MTPQRRATTDAAQDGLPARRKAASATSSLEYTARRQAIIKAAAQVFFDKGFNATTMQDIAVAAGVDRASVYYYVTSKSDLFEQTIGDAMASNTARAEEIAASSLTAGEKLEATIVELMMSYEREYPLLYAYVREDVTKLQVSSAWVKQMKVVGARYDKAIMGILAEGVSDGSFREDLLVREVAYALIGMTSWSHRWFRPGGALDGAAVGRALAQTFLNGITAR